MYIAARYLIDCQDVLHIYIFRLTAFTFTLPTRRETFPLKLCSALVAQLPVNEVAVAVVVVATLLRPVWVNLGSS